MRIVTGIRKTGVACVTWKVTRCAAVSYAAATVNFGYPVPDTHSRKNQSRFSPVVV
jgi:hypothetical protein